MKQYINITDKQRDALRELAAETAKGSPLTRPNPKMRRQIKSLEKKGLVLEATPDDRFIDVVLTPFGANVIAEVDKYDDKQREELMGQATFFFNGAAKEQRAQVKELMASTKRMSEVVLSQNQADIIKAAFQTSARSTRKDRLKGAKRFEHGSFQFYYNTPPTRPNLRKGVGPVAAFGPLWRKGIFLCESGTHTACPATSEGVTFARLTPYGIKVAATLLNRSMTDDGVRNEYQFAQKVLGRAINKVERSRHVVPRKRKASTSKKAAAPKKRATTKKAAATKAAAPKKRATTKKAAATKKRTVRRPRSNNYTRFLKSVDNIPVEIVVRGKTVAAKRKAAAKAVGRNKLTPSYVEILLAVAAPDMSGSKGRSFTVTSLEKCPKSRHAAALDMLDKQILIADAISGKSYKFRLTDIGQQILKDALTTSGGRATAASKKLLTASAQKLAATIRKQIGSAKGLTQFGAICAAPAKKSSKASAPKKASAKKASAPKKASAKKRSTARKAKGAYSETVMVSKAKLRSRESKLPSTVSVEHVNGGMYRLTGAKSSVTKAKNLLSA